MGIPSGYTSGQVIQAVVGVGKILQVVNATTTTAVANSTTTYATIGLTATITPSSSSSKILVLASCNGLLKTNGNANNGNNLRLLRGATTISDFGINLGYTGSTLYNMTSVSVCFLDSPATTSATTYVVHGANSNASAEVFFQRDSTMSTITLMEVSA